MKKKKALLLGGLLLSIGLVGCAEKTQPKKDIPIKNEYVEIKRYKGIEVKKVEPEKVTDDEIEATIQQLLEEHKEKKEIRDRKIQSGDVVVMDYQILNGANVVEEETGAEIEIGNSTFVQGVEEGLLGHAVGESYDIPITFPADYGNEVLNGTSVQFHVQIVSVLEQQLPTWNDAFVKEVTEGTTSSTEAYEKLVREQLEEEKQEVAEQEMQTKVWKKVLKQVTVLQYPEEALKEHVSAIQNAYREAGQDGEQLMNEAQAVELAEEALKEELTYQCIAKQENLTLSKEEMEKELDTLVKEYGYKDLATLRQAEASEQIAIFEEQIVRTKVLEWLLEHSNIK